MGGLFGSFQMHQYQSFTSSPPHSSRQLQTTSVQRSTNLRMLAGLSNGGWNLANVIIGLAPASSTACTTAANQRHCPNGSGTGLSNTNSRITCVPISRSRRRIRCRCSPMENAAQPSISLNP